MAGSANRLVWRIQRRLQPYGPVECSGLPSLRDIAELEARVHRLHAVYDCCSHVRLSGYVARGAAAGVLDRTGGEFVAKEG